MQNDSNTARSTSSRCVILWNLPGIAHLLHYTFQFAVLEWHSSENRPYYRNHTSVSGSSKVRNCYIDSHFLERDLNLFLAQIDSNKERLTHSFFFAYCLATYLTITVDAYPIASATRICAYCIITGALDRSDKVKNCREFLSQRDPFIHAL